MKTIISYDTDVEMDARIIKRLPQSSFECPKMNPGDIMDFDIVQPEGDHILTPVKVTQVLIGIGWNAKGPKKITDAEQHIFVTSDITNYDNAVHSDASTYRRKNNFSG